MIVCRPRPGVGLDGFSILFHGLVEISFGGHRKAQIDVSRHIPGISLDGLAILQVRLADMALCGIGRAKISYNPRQNRDWLRARILIRTQPLEDDGLRVARRPGCCALRRSRGYPPADKLVYGRAGKSGAGWFGIATAVAAVGDAGPI